MPLKSDTFDSTQTPPGPRSTGFGAHSSRYPKTYQIKRAPSTLRNFFPLSRNDIYYELSTRFITHHRCEPLDRTRLGRLRLLCQLRISPTPSFTHPCLGYSRTGRDLIIPPRLRPGGGSFFLIRELLGLLPVRFIRTRAGIFNDGRDKSSFRIDSFSNRPPFRIHSFEATLSAAVN